MNKYSEINSVMQDMINFFEEFSNLLQNKIEAINQNDVTALEQIMKQEQAFSMKIRGLENKRESALTKAGLTAEELKLLAQNPKDDEQQALAQTYLALKGKLEDYEHQSEIIKTQVELRLHSIKMVLEKLESNATQAIYDKSGVDVIKHTDEFKPTKV